MQRAPEDEPAAEVADDDPFNIIYSSGTTGTQKGIVHTHGIREAYGTGFASSFRVHPESVVLHAGSLVFNGAFVTLMPALYLGCAYVLLERFEPRATLDALAAERVTHVMTVPSQIVALLEHDDFDETHLPAARDDRVTRCAAAARAQAGADPTATAAAVRAVRADRGIRDDPRPGRGGAETRLGRRPAAALCAAHRRRRRCRAAGRPGRRARPDHDARLPPPARAHRRDARRRLGQKRDLGHVDEDGFLYLVDRKKDLIISGGVNVYPPDIEEVAVRHPDVLDVTVFGVPDERWGESPVAAVRLRDDAAAQADELREWINERVQARYQKLREVVVRDAFPASLAGKTLRRVIRDEYLDAQ